MKRYFNIIVFNKPILLPLDFIDLSSELKYTDDALIFMFDLNVIENIRDVISNIKWGDFYFVGD